MSTIFFTGFPGFLGTELLPRVLGREDAEVTATCLIQAKFRDLAEQRVVELEKQDPDLVGRIELVDGDITLADLGLGDRYDEIAADTIEVFHLAAVYDLAVPEEIATRVNVDGTRNVCDFAEAADARHQYVSTCYVSGRVTGAFTEDDLVVDGQVFNNHYESTKHAAEVIVRERMEAGHPTTIYRPAIVSGDSETGATQKFDGVFFAIRLIMRQPGPIAVTPLAGNPEAHTVNLVPRDYVVDAIAELSSRDDTVGTCFQLADPRPFSVRQILDTIQQVSGKRIITVPLTTWMAKGAIENVPGVQQLMQLPSDFVDYFTHPVHYTAINTQRALADTDVSLPDKTAWFRALVEFYKANPDVSSAAMV